MSRLSGHLDRVVHGTAAEDILSACDENATVTLSDNVGANPALHFFRGLRHRNLAAIKLAAQTGITNIQGKPGQVDQIRDKTRAFPLVINGFRSNPKDAEGHILFFDVEALIVQVGVDNGDTLYEAHAFFDTLADVDRGVQCHDTQHDGGPGLYEPKRV